MSNDLISRKETIEVVKTIIRAGLSEDAIYAELEELPTAYDVDKVCRKLREKAMSELGMTESRFAMDESENSSYTSLSLHDAIEIVRSGGKKE